MKVFLSVKLALLPLAAFGAFAMADLFAAGAWTGFALALGLVLWRRRAGQVPQLEAGMLAYLAVAAVLGAALGFGTPFHWMVALQATLALVCAASVARGRPWTADYSRHAFPAAAATPTFHLVNRALSVLWGVLFGCFAVLTALRAPGWTIAALVAIGALASIFGPKLLIHRYAARLLKTDRFDWRPATILPANSDVDVAVVGAGIGGLTAAALLARAGARVHVFERHVVAGGACHDFSRQVRHDGELRRFRFDAGVHDISGVRPGGPVSTLLERIDAPPIDWLRLDRRIVCRGRGLDIPRDIAEHVRMLQAMYPMDAAGIGELFADIRSIFDAMYAHARSGVPGRPRDLESLLAFPQRFPLAAAWMERPFVEFVRRRVTNAELIGHLLGLSGYVGDNAAILRVCDMVPLFGYNFFGGYYPRGGSGRLADALVAAIERHGGTVHLDTAVAKISVAAGAVRGLHLENGRAVRAGAVIANGDLRKTFRELIGQEHLPAAFAAELEASALRCSAVAVHLGLKRPQSGPPLVHVEGDAGGVGIVLPSAVDASAASPGYATMEIVRLVPKEEAKTWFPADGDLDALRDSEAYRARKRAQGDDLIRRAKQAFPDLEDDIVYRCDASPITYTRYLHSSLGSIYGVDGFQGAGVKSPIAQLVLSGAAVQGPGIEAVMIAGARAAEALLPGILDDVPAAGFTAGTDVLPPRRAAN